MCKNKVSVYVPKGYGYKEILLKCGSTGPDGEQVICDECLAKGIRPKPYDYLDAGEYWDENDY